MKNNLCFLQTISLTTFLLEFQIQSYLGNEIYRDSTGIYFSFPGLNIDYTEVIKKELIRKIMEVKENLKIDFSLQISITDESRSLIILSKQRQESLKNIIYPYYSQDINSCNQSVGDNLCPVCRLRVILENKERCRECDDRFVRTTDNWLKFPVNTIWLDEVADKNDRVALLVGGFDLSNWLSGEFIDTFLSEVFDNLRTQFINELQRLNINSLQDLENTFAQMFNSPNLNSDQKNLCKIFIGIRPNNFINDFWQPIAERDATGEALSLTDNSEKARYLIKLLFRKHPSPARIRRCWETTQEFIQKTIIEEILCKYNWDIDLRRQRIQFQIEPNPEVPIGSTISLDISGKRLFPVCIDKENEIFVSTCNLQPLKDWGDDIDAVVNFIRNRNIKLKKEDEGIWKEAKIRNPKPAEENYQNYFPFIKIFDSPDQFIILVPAYEAFDIAEKIYNEYEKQFSKVRDRLPLHLGIIGFHRRTTLYVAMDTAKRLFKIFSDKTKTKEATINKVSGSSNKEIKLQINCTDYSSTDFKWTFSYATGDPNVEDVWHPYIRLCNTPTNRNLVFDYTGNNDYVMHIKEIQQGDKIKIEPSYFCLTFIENSSDRFKIDEEIMPLHYIKEIGELWRNINEIVKVKKIRSSQIYAFWEEVEKKYKPLGEEYMKDCITNLLKISSTKDSKKFNKILQSIKNKTFEKCLFWNLSVKKEKL